VGRDSVQPVSAIEEYEGLLSIVAVGADRLAVPKKQGINFFSASLTYEASLQPAMEIFEWRHDTWVQIIDVVYN